MGLKIALDQPPESTSPELAEWLNKKIVQINLALDQTEMEVLYILPAKYKVGTIKYFGAAIPTTPITGEGLWIYKSGGWVQII